MFIFNRRRMTIYYFITFSLLSYKLLWLNEWISIAKNGYDNGLMVDGVFFWSKLLTICIIFYEYYEGFQWLFWFDYYRQSTITSFSVLKGKYSIYNMGLLLSYL